MDDVSVREVPADEAFELLAHETRVRTVEALAAANTAISFSDLRGRVGVDDPGQFNYHLSRLDGQFVASVDDGYELTAAGKRVVGAVRSGAYTGELDGETTVLDASCLSCGGGMEIRFRAEGVRITCRDCGFDYTHADVPAGVVADLSPHEAARRVERYLSTRQASAIRGFCPNCEGRMNSRVRLPSDDDAPPWLADSADPVVQFRCGRCGENWHSILPIVVATHPVVAGFLHEHGVNVRKTPNWEFGWLGDPVTVRSTDPLRVAVTARADDAERTFTFDADLEHVSRGE